MCFVSKSVIWSVNANILKNAWAKAALEVTMQSSEANLLEQKSSAEMKLIYWQLCDTTCVPKIGFNSHDSQKPSWYDAVSLILLLLFLFRINQILIGPLLLFPELAVSVSEGTD